MGKDDKEDSGFGFKDKAKAEETLRLLEQHDPNYRRLTVRGLLGRAKRVLSMTKAPEKIQNIKEAMEVFENWLADLEKNKEQKPAKKEKEDKKESKKTEKQESPEDVEMADQSQPTDSVPGLGFKDKAAAEATLEELEGRDPEYQKFAVKGLIGRANRVLTCTKDETKLSNINEAKSIFEKFLKDFENNNSMKNHNPYVSVGIVRTCASLAKEVTDQQKSFIAAYESVNGEYKKLRTVPEKDGGKTWDIVRNKALKKLKEKHANTTLFNDEDQPTPEHLQMLLWAYSPDASRTKKLIKESKSENDGEKRESRKRKSSADNESPSKKHKDE